MKDPRYRTYVKWAEQIADETPELIFQSQSDDGTRQIFQFLNTYKQLVAQMAFKGEQLVYAFFPMISEPALKAATADDLSDIDISRLTRILLKLPTQLEVEWEFI